MFAACNFDPNQAGQEPGTDGTDGGTTPTRGTCSVPGTRLCLEFETDLPPMQLALDASGNGHDAIATNVGLTTNSPHDSRAGEFLTATSSLTIADTPDLDLTGDVTMELWVRPGFGVGRYWLVDHGDRYFMSIGDDIQLRCGIDHDKTVDSNMIVPFDGAWHHVACTYNEANKGEIKVFIDGAVTDCKQMSTAITAGPSTTTIGVKNGSTSPTEHFYGDLDNVHIYARTLDPREICTLAGGAGCNAVCPIGKSD